MKDWKLMDNTVTLRDRVRMATFIMTNSRLTNGSKVREFESAWSNWLGAKYSLYVSSGSTANFLLLAAVMQRYGIQPGDKILLPACTWMTNVSPALQLGLKPIFCDINLYNYSFDETSLINIKEQHPDIKVIFVTHLLGLPADNHIYRDIFPEAIILDDVCESHGARDIEGRRIGSDSVGATFSFYFGHHMTTVEGGMVSTNDRELFDIMKMKRSHGLSRESLDPEKYAAQHPDINKSFLFVTDGYNFRNHEVCAVLGLSQLKRLDRMIDIRRSNYTRFWSLLNEHSDKFYVPLHPAGNSSFCFPLICKSKKTYDRLIYALAMNNIEFRPVVGGNLLRQPFLKGYSVSGSVEASNADILNDQGVYIGNSHFIDKSHLDVLEGIFNWL